jgi:DNA-directed RNA polymerase alpha subunit
MAVPEDVVSIANGEAFDTNQAIRTLARAMIKLAGVGDGSPVQEEIVYAGQDIASLLNSRLANALVRGGYGSPESLIAATDEELLAVRGVSDKALQQIREKVG